MDVASFPKPIRNAKSVMALGLGEETASAISVEATESSVARRVMERGSVNNVTTQEYPIVISAEAPENRQHSVQRSVLLAMEKARRVVLCAEVLVRIVTSVVSACPVMDTEATNVIRVMDLVRVVMD